MFYFIANWKQNLTLTDAQNWLAGFRPPTSPNCRTIIAGSFIHLPLLKSQSTGFEIAAQTVSRHTQGAYTGQVGADQLAGLVNYCLIGHSETRAETSETDKDVALKAKLLLANNITPIVCLDTPYLESQLTVLKHELLDLKNLVFAYEPLAAIGTGKPVSPKSANEIAFKIKNLTDKTLPVLYGGSVTADNAPTYLSLDFLSGFLVGKDSLNPADFAKIISCAP